MKKVTIVLMSLILFVGVYNTCVFGADLTLPNGGRVAVELITSGAAFHNTLSLVSHSKARIVLTGCEVEAIDAFSLELLSEKTSQHGCRVELDADRDSAGVQPFNAGDVLEFNLCAQADADPTDCEYHWSSNPIKNTDGKDHVKTTELHIGDPDVGGRIFMLAWEDQDNLGDQDFDDLIAVVRVVKDTDEDGLWDDWEKFGIDTNGNGTVDYQIPNADRNHKDIYIEIDYMDCTAGGDCIAGDTHSHEPKSGAINEVVQAFANAPVTNPDGIDGITLHVDVDDAIPHQNFMNLGCYPGSTADYDAIKNNPAYFGPNNKRRFVYHYLLFTHRQISSSTSSGCGELPGNDFIVSLGEWNTICIMPGNNNVLDTAPAGDDLSMNNRIYTGPDLTCDTTATGDDVQIVVNGNSPPSDVDNDGSEDRTVGTIRQQSATLMHELGHNLNLQHGGGDCTNYKPNYLSIMNYWFQFLGILPGGQLNYSEDALPDLNERTIGGVGQLDETVGIQDGTNDTKFVCPDWSGVVIASGTGPIDWNCDGDGGQDTNVSVNINGDCADTVKSNCGDCDPGEPKGLYWLWGYNDWDNLKYDFQNSKNFEDGMHVEMDIPDMTFPNYLVNIDLPPISDPNGPYISPLYICFDGTGSSDPDGDPLSYSWVFGDGNTNTGETPCHTYAEAGIYDVCLTVNDGKVNSQKVCTSAVIYDASAGFVSGGGWIDSSVGAYVPDPNLSGTANFGFFSKYQKKSDVPTGQTEFMFQVAGLNFHSDSYQWLIVNNDGTRAQYKGEGTINGQLDSNENPYKFMLWAGDNEPDTFRIRIWEEDDLGTETVIYDNGSDQAIGGGSIVIHAN